jgi:hypothetical protein
MFTLLTLWQVGAPTTPSSILAILKYERVRTEPLLVGFSVLQLVGFRFYNWLSVLQLVFSFTAFICWFLDPPHLTLALR